MTKLTTRPKEIPCVGRHERRTSGKLFERQMETFAGFAAHTDHEVGRLVAQLEAIGELDNTLFFYIVGDNGSSAEGGPEGTYNEMMALNGIIGKADQMMAHIDDWGGPTTFPHYAIGWAWARQYPLPVDETGGQPLRRHAQRHGHALAQRHQGERERSAASSIT
jgi:arylsulfatase A-like enzyme